jgi:hypothetical protein
MVLRIGLAGERANAVTRAKYIVLFVLLHGRVVTEECVQMHREGKWRL